MARIAREGDLIRIFAMTTSGKERLVVAAKAVPPLCRPAVMPVLYDMGGEITITSRYAIGAAPSRRRRFAEDAHEIRATFAQAGLPEPQIVKANALHRYFMPLLHRISRMRATRTKDPVITMLSQTMR